MTAVLCDCQSGLSYAACCQPWHQGAAAADAQALMRSRFCAFRLQLADYLLATWHPDTRPASLGDLQTVSWRRLTVHEHQCQGDQAQVRFEAFGLEAGKPLLLQELSQFERLAGRWYYHSGAANFSTPVIGRNQPCLCGSTRKAKRCCLA